MNICSLVPRINEVGQILGPQKLVIAITEISLSDMFDVTLIKVRGYDFFEIDRGSRGGGVGIYVRADYI